MSSVTRQAVRQRRRTFAAVAAGLLATLSQVTTAAALREPTCVLRLALDTPFPPHIILSEQQPEGINVRMLEALAAQVGCSVRFVQSPWARALKLLQQGEVDVVSQLSYTPARAKDIAFIGPHHDERMWFIANPAAVPPLHQLADLARWPADMLVAVLNGGYFGEALQQLRADPTQQRRFYPMVSNQDKLALLETGRVQAVLEEEFAWHWRVKNSVTPFQPLLLVHADAVYFGFSRVSIPPERLKKLADAWQQLYRSGQLQQIRREYLFSAKWGFTSQQSTAPQLTLSDMPVPRSRL